MEDAQHVWMLRHGVEAFVQCGILNLRRDPSQASIVDRVIAWHPTYPGVVRNRHCIATTEGFECTNMPCFRGADIEEGTHRAEVVKHLVVGRPRQVLVV